MRAFFMRTERIGFSRWGKDDYPLAVQLGFHLRRKFWGMGYASDAAGAVVRYGFETLKAARLFAGRHPQNAGSRKLLSKLGFEYIGDKFYAPTGLYHPSCEMHNPPRG